MRALVCIELAKAFKNKMFAVAVAIGSVLALATSLINYFTIYYASTMAAASYETKWFDPSILRSSRVFGTGW